MTAQADAAEERLIGGTDCTLRDGETGRVREIVDGDTLVLDSGLSVRLVGMQAPKLPLDRPGFAAWPLADEAKAALSRLALGRMATLRYGGARRDRYDRALGHVFVTDDAGEFWLQEEMVRAGFARVYSFADNRACLARLMAAERSARMRGVGLWRDPYYAIRAASDPNLGSREDFYDLIEGRVVSIGRRGQTVYLDFGRDWSTDFTVVMAKEVADAVQDGGIPVEALKGRRVRLRGWVERHAGASMRVTHPEQIELLDGDALDGE